MATKTFNTRIANKRDTSANWTSNNPVLLNGEVIIVDTEAGQVRYKVGNGTSTYTQLPFTDESLITNINGKLSLSGGTMTGNIDMGGHKLTGLGAPVNPNDAVRQTDLKVVSDEVDGIISGTTGITLAPATTTKIGGVIVGDGIEVEADGTISTNPVPDGGTEGQMLYKAADGAEWGDKPNIYVNIEYSDGSYSADKTYEEIRQLLLDGFHVFARYGGLIFVLSSCLLESTISSIKFFNARYESYSALRGSFFEIEPDSSVSNNSFDLDFSNYVPVTRSINGNRLSRDVHLSAEDVNAIENPANGTEGQILAKTSSGAAWVDAPESGLTQEQADDRYLQLSGGALTGNLTIKSGSLWLRGVDCGIWGSFNSSELNFVVNGTEVLKVNGGSVSLPTGLTISGVRTPTSDSEAANKSYVDSKAPTSVTVTLTTSGWSSNTQTVTVSGVVASETAQLITPTPAIASQSAYYEAGIMCTGQAANSLTFTCQTVPTSNLTVYVVIQPLS